MRALSGEVDDGGSQRTLLFPAAYAIFWSLLGRSVGKDSRDIIRELEADGWRFVGASGSHHHFKHPLKPGKVTIPHPRRDLHPKTLRSIYRQAGLKESR